MASADPSAALAVVAASEPPAAAASRPVRRGSYGVVAIGRNEGERLRRCLQSLDPRAAPLVYVDSGSTDGSAEMAAAMGATVVALDMAIPFTAARARNQGCMRLFEIDPALDYVQFVDGDCEVDPGWLAHARVFLDTHHEVVAVSGRRRERHPDRSVYNAMCDIDWRWSLGETRAFGGDVLLRAAALREVGGYDASLIAGEEPELAIRLRRRGWRIWQTDAPMTLHDADMHRFGQWWKRCLRTGHAYAEGAAMHGAPPERHWVRERWSAVFWGLALPAMALAASLASPPLALALLAVYPLQWLRLWRRGGVGGARGARIAFLRLVAKFAEAAGVVRYALSRRRGVAARLIEYK